MKTLITILTIIAICHPLHTIGQTIKEIIPQMPHKIVGGITDKQQLLDNPSADTLYIPTDIAPNIRRTHLNDNYIRIETSSVGNTQIKLLPSINGSKIICVVTTICTEQLCDSRIEFYDVRWMSLAPHSLFPTITIYDFLQANIDTTCPDTQKLLSMVKTLPIKIQISEDKNEIYLTPQIQYYLPHEVFTRIAPLLSHEAITWSWNQSSFSKQ